MVGARGFFLFFFSLSPPLSAERMSAHLRRALRQPPERTSEHLVDSPLFFLFFLLPFLFFLDPFPFSHSGYPCASLRKRRAEILMAAHHLSFPFSLPPSSCRPSLSFSPLSFVTEAHRNMHEIKIEGPSFFSFYILLPRLRGNPPLFIECPQKIVIVPPFSFFFLSFFFFFFLSLPAPLPRLT